MGNTMRHCITLLLLLTTACGTGGSVNLGVTPKAAPGAPERFEPVNRADRLVPADTLAGSGCLSPMVDPRDGYQLRFERAAGGVADYPVPTGRYGVRPGELLRLECNSGRGVGRVGER